MPRTPSSIKNAYKRSDVYRKQKKDKAHAKLKRRLETKKDEMTSEDGQQKKKERLAAKVPRTIDNTRIYGTSYLTSNPNAAASSSSQPIASTSTAKEGSDAEDSDEDADDDGEEEDAASLFSAATGTTARLSSNASSDPQGGIGAIPSHRGLGKDPKILVTTSAKATRDTYTFAEELTAIFPGGEFFKRPVGKGFEQGRISRWAGKRGFDAVVIINEDRKIPNAITIINLPLGPTAYFKLTSIQLGKEISGHARPTAHSPELILNNFQTRLGLSIGKLFGSLFPPLPQFQGRQVVTLHNQRDFLFFRRHRYMFKSVDKTALQEIGPRFTLKLRWLKKGLPAVTTGGSVASEPKPSEEALEDEDDDKEELEAAPNGEKAEKGDEEEEDDELAVGEEAAAPGEGEEDGGAAPVYEAPPLNAQGEYEWKWRPKLEVNRRTAFL